jgi:putative inorganic carbon (hco3(-)) transporter
MITLWIFLSLIFIRPFISSLAFPYLNFFYSLFLFIFLSVWLLLKKAPLKEIRPLKYPLIALTLALAISLSFSSDRTNSLKELYKYAGGFLIFLTCIKLPFREKKLVLKTLVLSAVVICALAIYQYIFGFSHLFNYLARQRNYNPLLLRYLSQKRAFLPFITPEILAGYLVLVFPLILAIKKNRDLWFIVAIFAVALLLTKSMGGLLSILLGAGFYLYLKRDISYIKFVFLGIIITISLAVFSLRQTAIIEAFSPASSLLNRIAYWRDSLALIKLHPFTGIGPGNFNLPLSRYAHNIFLQIWAETGVIGLISFIWLIGCVIKSGLRHIQTSPHREEIICLMTANFIFLVENLTSFTFFLPEVSLIWWAILGLAVLT